MRYRKLGRSGLKVSELSLGSWVTFGGQVDEGATLDCLEAAHQAGVNFFDGAEAYARGQAELVMGRLLQRLGWRRSSLVLSSKIFWGGDGPNDVGLSHKHLVEGVEAALERWQTRYLDLVFCHRPDPDTPVEETVRAFDVLVRQGKVFYWGTSEWSRESIEEAFAVAERYHLTPPTMEQPQYNLLVRERFEVEYAPLFAERRYGATIWSPLASGLLSGKYQQGLPPGARLAMPQYQWLKDRLLTPDALEKVGRLEPIARELGCTLSQLAIAWCLKNPHVSSVITGATRPEQVRENMASAEVAGKLDAAMMERLARAVA